MCFKQLLNFRQNMPVYKKISLGFAIVHMLIVVLLLIILVISKDPAINMIWFLLYYIDFPYSAVTLFLAKFIPDISSDINNFWAPFILWGVGGTLWWYSVPILVKQAVTLGKKIMKK
ncbi:MAG: hypothetical protein J0H12_04650 [Candidatus Paracaedimonas acanthamoebae]|uniref:Uncharacterized protein n=1 Tax=Candidatus Paracaedimonas acanthamoebae TaxID=244581 RepID=A0A8J7PJ88_9PROT|nr:hypothetical protein [Candidatus Paracaedimonas acanthamoebae]